jgi:hypothetical protein
MPPSLDRLRFSVEDMETQLFIIFVMAIAVLLWWLVQWREH